ncbi:AAA family ATPase, partial [Solirubrobacter taibaiensis]|nr:AAA family ATPase [Solirubrobacter taibaiensis]
MELIGRARELELLERALADVRAGGTRGVALVGEAGIGKSALLDALIERADGLRVLRGRATEHEREVPFALAADAFGEVALESGPPAARLRTHRALAAELARESPAVLVLDDLHWADDASLELLDHLIRRPPAAPHLLVVSARPGTSLPQLDVLTLDPLDRAASLALVTSAHPASGHEAILTAAGGNPLYLRELARAAGSEARPPCLLDAVRRETGSLAADAAALLAGAAVAGDPFDPELAAAAAGMAPDAAALDALCARDLIRPTGNGRLFAFRHPLLRHCVYDTIPPGRRLDAHERAAAALAARGAGLAAQAYHVERCGRAGDPAATALLRDAAAAVARTAPATAARWYEAALRLLGDEPVVRAALLAPLGLALAAAGRYVAAREALDEAYALAPSLEVAVACARVDTELGRYAEARRRLRPEQRRPLVALELAAIAFHEGVLTDLTTWAEPARRATVDRPVPHAAALALCALGAAWTDEPDRATSLLEQATATLDAAADAQLATDPSAALYVATAQLLLVHLADAERTIERVLALGDERFTVRLRLTRAMARFQRGVLDDALADVDAAEELARLEAQPRPLHFALWLRALVEHERGNADASARAARECAALTPTMFPDKLVRTGGSTAAVLGATEDPQRALREATALVGETIDIADRAWSSWLLLRLVRAALAAGDQDRARHWARLAHDRARQPLAIARAQVAAAELALAAPAQSDEATDETAPRSAAAAAAL